MHCWGSHLFSCIELHKLCADSLQLLSYNLVHLFFPLYEFSDNWGDIRGVSVG
jgi:hypothetical protein